MAAINHSEVAPTPTGGTAVIAVEEVHKYYDHALRGASVEVRRGEFVAIMGASGSGKSTFMNMLGCLDRPSSGRYLLEGIDVSQHDKKALALIRNQRLVLFFKDSIFWQERRRSKVPSCLRYTPRSTRPNAVNEQRKPWRWSAWPTGPSIFLRKCRVGSSNALRSRGRWSMADEPTGNLDSRTSVEIMEIFQILNDKGLTIVLVTHEQDTAQFAKRIPVFRDGKIRKDDPVVGRPRASEVLEGLPTLED
jgi:putative ABC transport system ATP-binding protein